MDNESSSLSDFQTVSGGTSKHHPDCILLLVSDKEWRYLKIPPRLHSSPCARQRAEAPQNTTLTAFFSLCQTESRGISQNNITQTEFFTLCHRDNFTQDPIYSQGTTLGMPVAVDGSGCKVSHSVNNGTMSNQAILWEGSPGKAC